MTQAIINMNRGRVGMNVKNKTGKDKKLFGQC